MPEWLPSLMGPGGAIIAVVILGKMGFNFLINMIKEQRVEQQERDVRLEKLQIKTLDHIHENTLATSLQTEALRTLGERLQIFLDR